MWVSHKVINNCYGFSGINNTDFLMSISVFLDRYYQLLTGMPGPGARVINLNMEAILQKL